MSNQDDNFKPQQPPFAKPKMAKGAKIALSVMAVVTMLSLMITGAFMLPQILGTSNPKPSNIAPTVPSRVGNSIPAAVSSTSVDGDFIYAQIRTDMNPADPAYPVNSIYGFSLLFTGQKKYTAPPKIENFELYKNGEAQGATIYNCSMGPGFDGQFYPFAGVMGGGETECCFDLAEFVNAPSPGEYWCEMTVNGVDVRTNTFVWHEDGSYELLDDFVLPTSRISIAPQGDSRIGDIIRLGGYDWRILDVQEGKAFIITEYVYTSGPFHALDKPANLPQNAVYGGALVTRETSGLRSYLNGEFYDGFSDEEKGKILDTTINCDNPYSNVYGGNETTDKVFLLSAEEVVRYLLFDGGEIVEGDGRTIYSMPGILNSLTPLAIMSEGGEPTHDWDGDWWLRTIGSGFSSPDNSIPVLTAGGDRGNPDRFELELTHKLSSEPSGVRPAMWIALDGDAVGGSAPTQPSAPPSTDSPVQADRLAITLQIGNSAESYEGVYRGEVLNNLPNGQGSATFTNAIGEQQTYIGSWEAGHFEGEGKWEDSGYLKYEGVFENNLMVSGKMYDNSGQLYYEGDFREGLRDENAAALQARIDGYAAEAVLYDGRDWADYDDGQIVAYECVLEEVIPDMFSVAIGTMQPNGKSVYRENYSPAYGETIPPVGSQVVLYYRVFRDSDFGSTHEALLACVPM